jgi:hypothetical protein
LRKFRAHFGIIFCHQIFDCFNSGYIIKRKLEIIGGALYLQQKNRPVILQQTTVFYSEFSRRISRERKIEKIEANFDGFFYEIFYVIKIGGKNPFYREVGFFHDKSSSRDK